jgi:cation diffusion facilitator family transporter
MAEHSHSHKEHSHDKDHGHTHGSIDPSISTSERGIWAIKWSFIGFLITSGIQFLIVLQSGSIALLTDAIHNFGDAGTAIPLWIAFRMAKRKPSKTFTYGYGRIEDLAGVFIVLIIFLTTLYAGYQSIFRLFHPQGLTHLWAVLIAGLVGFIGNEAIALFRIKVGKEIKSAALIADGYHARVDGLASLAIIAAVIGIWLGYPIADPLVGLLIVLIILKTLWDSSKEIFTRLIDGVDPHIIEEVTHEASHAEGVEEVTEVRARWSGHFLLFELNIAVKPDLSVEQGHTIAVNARHDLLHHMPHIANVVIHIDPSSKSGEKHH